MAIKLLRNFILDDSVAFKIDRSTAPGEINILPCNGVIFRQGLQGLSV